mmetsp:Transcript_31416/g.80194  ORF Transcript_31416/g.80194 Transcript_31416/m.80194 type:complete len:240 (+) Transcript_31416:1056-1775(+)
MGAHAAMAPGMPRSLSSSRPSSARVPPCSRQSLRSTAASMVRAKYVSTSRASGCPLGPTPPPTLASAARNGWRAARSTLATQAADSAATARSLSPMPGAAASRLPACVDASSPPGPPIRLFSAAICASVWGTCTLSPILANVLVTLLSRSLASDSILSPNLSSQEMPVAELECEGGAGAWVPDCAALALSSPSICSWYLLPSAVRMRSSVLRSRSVTTPSCITSCSILTPDSSMNMAVR